MPAYLFLFVALIQNPVFQPRIAPGDPVCIRYPKASAEELRARACLDTVVPEVKFDGLPIEQALNWLREFTHVSIEATWAVTRDTPITLRTRDLTVRSIVELLCEELSASGCRVDFELREEGVRIRPADAGDRDASVLRVYPIRDILAFGVNTESTSLDATRSSVDFAEVLRACVAAENWSDGGGEGDARVAGGALVVRASRRTHEAVEEFLTALRDANDAVGTRSQVSDAGVIVVNLGESDGTNAVDCDCEYFPRPGPAEQRFRKALRLRVPEVSFDDCPLDQVLEWVAGYAGLPIRVDWATLEDAGIARNKPALVKVKGLRVQQWLAVIADEAGGADVPIGFDVRPTGVHFSTREALRNALVTRVYPVDEVLAALARSQGFIGDGELGVELAELVTRMIEPQVWRDGGGPGVVRCLGPLLVVRTSRDVHAEICPLLKSLRAALTY